MPKRNSGNGARLAVALGLGLTLSFGAVPLTTLAEPTEGAASGLEQPSADSNEDIVTPPTTGPETNDPQDNVAVSMTQDGGETGQYESISKALEKVAPYDYRTNKGVYTITLIKNVVEDVTIPAGVNVTINLAGHRLTNAGGHTITNNSTRTVITDSAENGVVDNVSHGCAAVYNNINASITLKGGTFSRSAEASKGADDAGENSWYVLKNFGSMTINDGVTVKFSDTNPGRYSSLIGSGWQNSAAAEQGSNGEPRPSESKDKATLTINGGTFVGGKITVKNDDYGVLTVKGGFISQGTDSYYAIYNANKATISGGTISAKSDAIGSQHYEGGANDGSLTVSGGTITSVSGSAVSLLTGAKGTIKGVTFQGGSDQYVIDVDDGSSAVISAGTFKGTTKDKVVSKAGSFADRYGVMQDENGNLVATVTDAQATVTARDGSVTRYESLSKALSNAPAGSTVTLQENVELTKKVATKNFGVTLDLNGHNVTSTVTSDAAITLGTNYGVDPVEGVDSTMRLINSKPGNGGVIKAEIPLGSKAGDSTKPVALEVGEGVTLSPTDPGSDAVRLESSAYLRYSEQAVDYIKNGGFRIVAEDGDRIYGSYANAAGAAVDGTVTILHDYVGTSKIISGDHTTVLDLGGHTYVYTGSVSNNNSIVEVNYDGASLTIKNGTLKTSSNPADGVLMLYSDSSLVLDGVTVEVPHGAYGIVTNGGQKNNSITMRNSILTVTEGAGIYFPSTGSVLIDSSAITAKTTGVQLCAGNLTVQGNDTKITVTGEPDEKTESDGVIPDGAAISIVERVGFRDLGAVSIKGGTFTSAEDVDAIKAYAFSNDNKIEQEWDAAGEVVSVSGGFFSTPVPADLCADGLEPVNGENGSNTVGVAENKIVTISDAEGNVLAAYDTLSAAAAAASEGQVIDLLDDVKESSPINIVASGVTVNGNNHTITCASSYASGAFVTVGKGSNDVTIKDVTLNIPSATFANKHGIQFYENDGGALENVTVNGGTYTSVMVNGSTNVMLSNCDLNPHEGAYANIEYGMGDGVATVPSLTVEDVSFQAPAAQIWVDNATVSAIKGTLPAGSTNDDVVSKVHESITNRNERTITVSIKLGEGDDSIVTEKITSVTNPPYVPPVVTGDKVNVEQAEGGKVTVTPSRADEGDEVTVTATPDEGQ